MARVHAGPRSNTAGDVSAAIQSNLYFRDATALVPYLAALGISHCYASPYLKARPGSMHGYDIIDHNSLNPEIGSPDDYEHFVSELHRHGMPSLFCSISALPVDRLRPFQP